MRNCCRLSDLILGPGNSGTVPFGFGDGHLISPRLPSAIPVTSTSLNPEALLNPPPPLLPNGSPSAVPSRIRCSTAASAKPSSSADFQLSGVYRCPHRTRSRKALQLVPHARGRPFST